MPSVLAFEAHPLVHVNAALNTLATILLILGFIFMMRGKYVTHGRTMISAFVVSCAFLVSYLIYHFVIVQGSVKFTHPGIVKTIYLAILFSHIVLAATVPFLAVATIYYALRGFGLTGSLETPTPEAARALHRHRKLARWTFPIWLYVSITGVIVYVMLYHLWPPTAQ